MRRSRFLLCVCLLGIALPRVAVAQQIGVAAIRVGTVADKLGVKASPSAPIELDLGHSATAMLADPQKIAPYGIRGMHEGARVTITCIGPNRLRVEADEMEPVPQQAKVTLQVGEDGKLTPVNEKEGAPAAKPPF